MRFIALSLGLMLSMQAVFAQNSLPDTKMKTLKGEEVSFSKVLGNSDTAVIVSLWATWCVPCITELETLKHQYEDRQKEAPFKIVAVSVDDSRTSNRVKSFTRGKGWTFDVYLDVNNELRRDLNISFVPHVLLVKNGKIIYQHSGYTVGDEEALFAAIKAAK